MLIKIPGAGPPREWNMKEIRKEIRYDPRKVFGKDFDTGEDKKRNRFWRRSFQMLVRDLLEEDRQRAQPLGRDAIYRHCQRITEEAMNRERAQYSDIRDCYDDTPIDVR